MGRYIYNSVEVENGLTALANSIPSIESTNESINSGIRTIEGARGSEYLSFSIGALIESNNQIIAGINELTASINEKKTAIEEYNSTPFLRRKLKELFATNLMIGSKLFEGVLTAGEQILDGFATLTGLVVGIFDEEAKGKIGEFVAKDHVGDAFKEAYSEGTLSDVERYSLFSSNSTGAKIIKGIGVAGGYVAGGYITGGGSLVANASLAGIGGIGSGTEEALQSGATYNEAAWAGVKKGAVQAGTVVVATKGAEKLSGLLSKQPVNLGNVADDAVSSGAKLLGSGTDDVIAAAGNVADDAVSSGAKLLGDGTDEFISNGVKVTKEGGWYKFTAPDGHVEFVDASSIYEHADITDIASSISSSHGVTYGLPAGSNSSIIVDAAGNVADAAASRASSIGTFGATLITQTPDILKNEQNNPTLVEIEIPTIPEDPTLTIKNNTPSQPTAPSKPTTPSQPTAPSKPTTPSQPTAPSKPTTPSQPTAPSKPTTPSQPTAPSKPNDSYKEYSSINNSTIDSYNNSTIDSYNNSTIDSYNNSTIDSYNTTNNYYGNNKETSNNEKIKENIEKTENSNDTLKTIIGISAAGLAGIGAAAGYTAIKDKKEKKKDEEDYDRY